MFWLLVMLDLSMVRKMWWWGVIILGLSMVGSLGAVTETSGKCEPIKIELCAQLGYNATGMPNLIGHQLQGDAKYGLETYFPLIQYGCSPDLQFFLCSVYAPMCVELPPDQAHVDTKQQHLIGPCRPLCLRVRSSCYPVLQEFKLPWPAQLECDKFPPTNNHEHMCMDGGNMSRNEGSKIGVSPGKAFNSLQRHPDLMKRVIDFKKEKPALNIYDPLFRLLKNSQTSVSNMKPAQGFSGECSGVAFPKQYYSLNRTGDCVPKCGADVFFDEENKEFAVIWLAVWSILCFLSTLFTLATFLLDTARFKYPEKSIIFLNLSYNIFSLGYIVRLGAGSSLVSCTAVPGVAPLLLVKEGLVPSTPCTIVFLLLYFSGLAAASWWCIMTATWAIVTVFAVDVKNLESRSPILHCIGWGVPAILTISAPVLHQVEGDELTGVCLPGQQNDSSLLHQLVIPHSILLATATLSLLAGGVASIASSGQGTDKLLARIGIFSILYTLPQVCVVGSLIYEWMKRDNWRSDPLDRPNVEVFMLRIFMWLVVGVISGSWVWSHKTLAAWKILGTRCFGFWSGAKKPATPVFPTVAYHPAKTSSDTSPRDKVSIKVADGFKRGKGDGSLPPLAWQERRIVL